MRGMCTGCVRRARAPRVALHRAHEVEELEGEEEVGARVRHGDVGERAPPHLQQARHQRDVHAHRGNGRELDGRAAEQVHVREVPPREQGLDAEEHPRREARDLAEGRVQHLHEEDDVRHRELRPRGAPGIDDEEDDEARHEREQPPQIVEGRPRAVDDVPALRGGHVVDDDVGEDVEERGEEDGPREGREAHAAVLDLLGEGRRR